MGIVVFTACTNEYYEQYNVNTYSKYFEVNSRDWKKAYDDLGYLYYYFTFEEPKLTNKVINSGSLNTYLYYQVEGIDTFSPLPFSDFIVKNEYRWEEQTTVEYQPGLITFILKSDDRVDQYPAYEQYVFAVRFLW